MLKLKRMNIHFPYKITYENKQKLWCCTVCIPAEWLKDKQEGLVVRRHNSNVSNVVLNCVLRSTRLTRIRKDSLDRLQVDYETFY